MKGLQFCLNMCHISYSNNNSTYVTYVYKYNVESKREYISLSKNEKKKPMKSGYVFFLINTIDIFPKLWRIF